MNSLPNFYRAEIDYHREALLRDLRPVRTRQAVKAAEAERTDAC